MTSDGASSKKFFRLDVVTSSISGTVATPLFKQSFDRKSFETLLQLSLKIEIKESISSTSGSLVVDVEYDVEEIGFVEYVRVNNENLDTTKYKATLEYPLDTGSVSVEYRREIEPADLESWHHKRNTGMTVTWYYTVQVDVPPEVKKESEVFTQLANVLHQHQQPDVVWAEVRRLRKELLKERPLQCGDWKVAFSHNVQLGLSSIYGNVTSDPVYRDQVSEGSSI